jgi:hypothetical protein
MQLQQRAFASALVVHRRLQQRQQVGLDREASIREARYAGVS